MTMDLSVHTMVIHNKISSSEARHLCSLYDKSLSKNVELSGTDIKIAGINQINMKGSQIPDSGVWTYDIWIQVNVGRLIKQAKVAMLVLNKRNANAIIKRLTNIFTKTFCFKEKHCDSAEWHISRFDCGLDLKLGTDDDSVLKAFIKALHTSFDSGNVRGVQYSEYKGYDEPQVQYESVTLETAGYKKGNPLYRYNIYYKLLQLLQKSQELGFTLSQDEINEAKEVIRIEKQIDDVSKIFGCSSKLSTLLNEDVTEKVMNSIIKEMKLFFGTGDYLTYEQGVARINASNHDKVTRDKMVIVYAYTKSESYSALLDDVARTIKANGGSDADVTDIHKDIAMLRKHIEALGISVASVQGVSSMKGISTLLDEELTARAKPRKKHQFSEIVKVPVKRVKGHDSSRYMCKPTIQLEDGTIDRTSIASSVGGTREECEVKVFEKIRYNLNTYYKSLAGQPEKQIECCENAIYDYERFRTIVQSKTVRKDIDVMLDKIKARITKKQEECLYGKQQ